MPDSQALGAHFKMLTVHICRSSINLAKKLAIPLSIFKKLSKKDLYILEKNVPDEIEQYFDLKTFPSYLINKYKLKPDSALIPSTNATQKDIELCLTWRLTRFLSKLDKSNTHFALMLPKHDRGIECYIRCLDIENDFLVGIPIQICEIVFTKELITKYNYEKIVFDLAVRAKSKPVDCAGAILLLNLNKDGNCSPPLQKKKRKAKKNLDSICSNISVSVEVPFKTS